jgi:hypothetical protein
MNVPQEWTTTANPFARIMFIQSSDYYAGATKRQTRGEHTKALGYIAHVSAGFTFIILIKATKIISKLSKFVINSFYEMHSECKLLLIVCL